MTAQTAMVEVKYVNPPKDGKQYGSIKGANNQTWPIKKDRIGDFEPGNTYELAYTLGTGDFRNVIGVKKIAKAAPEPSIRGEFAKIEGKPQANGSTYYRPTAPRDSERMFVCAIAGHWIDTGRVEMTEQSMIELVNSLRAVYAATFGVNDTAA
jgi:hypothetical protein